MAQHWDGAAFSFVPTPTPLYGFDVLHAVAAVAPDDVWAVGAAAEPSVHTKTLTHTEHWDGTEWSIVPSPNREFPGFEDYHNRLYGVDAVASDEVWAVGRAFGFDDVEGRTRDRTLALRWNGRTWQLILSPNATDIRHSELFDVDALASGRVWAVGASRSESVRTSHTLVLARC
jgi:hypothetical protein